MAAKTTFILEANEAKAVNAYLRVVDAQNKAITGTRKLTREGKGAGKSMEGIGRSIMGWAAGIASVATLRRGLRAVFDEMERIKEAQKTMYDAALTNEDRILKIAHLRGDLSKESRERIRKEIADLALETSVSLEVANKAKFYMESAYGTGPAAATAALTEAKFAGPAGINPEEITVMPAILKKWEAETTEEQMKVFSQIYAGTKASLADVGQYLPQLIKAQSTAKESGFTLAETIALLTTAIEASGLETAGKTLQSSILYGTGRTAKAHKYLSKEVAKKGKEWGEMGSVERYWFTADLYQELHEKGPAAEDVFKLALGGRGYQYFQQMFSKTAKRKYEETLPVIIETMTSNIIDVMAEQFKEWPKAAAARHATLAETGAATTGEAKEPFVELSKMSAKMIEQADAKVKGWGDIIRFGLTPEKIRGFNMAQNILQENLLLAIEAEGRGTAKREELSKLYFQTYQPSPFATRPDYLRDVYEATEGFELVSKKGRLVSDEFRVEAEKEAGLLGGERPEHYTRGLEAYYGIAEAMAEHAKAIQKNTAAINQFMEIMTTGTTSSRLSPDE